MAELKTRPNEQSVAVFLKSVVDEQQRKDARDVLRLMQKVTGLRPKMWGPSIVGFGSYHYKYDSGREGDWFLTGFSPRKRDLTIYIMAGFSRYDALTRNLGKFKTGQSCLYIHKLADIDLRVLEELIRRSVEYLRERAG